jgi:hypothetical protein
MKKTAIGTSPTGTFRTIVLFGSDFRNPDFRQRPPAWEPTAQGLTFAKRYVKLSPAKSTIRIRSISTMAGYEAANGRGGPLSTPWIVHLAALAAWLVTGSVVVGLVMIGLFFANLGSVFGTLNDLSLTVMTVALAPVMAGYYMLGGRTPLVPATLSLASGIGAILVWSVAQALFVAGLVDFAYGQPATGALAIQTAAVGVIGLWLAGANLLAGPWLTDVVRWLGVIAGVGVVIFAAGLFLGGAYHPATFVGAIGYQLVLPVWAFLLGRLLRRHDGSSRSS